MSYAHRPGKCTTMTPVEALEMELERCWCGLTKWPSTVYLTPSGRLVPTREGVSNLGAEEVGRYTKAVTLADFRGDVFHVFEAMTRRGHRHAG